LPSRQVNRLYWHIKLKGARINKRCSVYFNYHFDAPFLFANTSKWFIVGAKQLHITSGNTTLHHSDELLLSLNGSLISWSQKCSPLRVASTVM
jgi:hypothetical protein